MNIRILLCSFILIISINSLSFGQTQMDIIIDRQSQLDSLSIKYPNGNINLRNLTISGGNITNLSALTQIKSITGTLTFENIVLDSIHYIKDIKSINNIYLIENLQLEWLDNLPNLKSLNIFSIENCPSLDNLSFLNAVETIWWLDIKGKTAQLMLSDFFQNLKYLSLFSMTDNKGIDTLIMDNLQSHTHVFLHRNEHLSYINAFNNSKNLNNDAAEYSISIKDNPKLQYIEIFNNWINCENVEINSNPELRTIIACKNTSKITSTLAIENNPKLDSIFGFNKASYIQNIVINKNLLLKNLNSFQSIKKVINIAIHENITLKNFNGAFINVDTIGEIKLEKGGLYISGNRSLNSIVEFANLKFMNSFTILDNKRLGMCSIKSICDHINAGRPFKVDADNYPGCRSKNQILSSCISENEDILDNKRIIVSPNPATSIINLNTYDFQEIELMYIISSDGNFIRLNPEKLETTISISSLPPGNFWVVYRTGDKIEKANFTKI